MASKRDEDAEGTSLLSSPDLTVYDEDVKLRSSPHMRLDDERHSGSFSHPSTPPLNNTAAALRLSLGKEARRARLRRLLALLSAFVFGLLVAAVFVLPARQYLPAASSSRLADKFTPDQLPTTSSSKTSREHLDGIPQAKAFPDHLHDSSLEPAERAERIIDELFKRYRAIGEARDSNDIRNAIDSAPSCSLSDEETARYDHIRGYSSQKGVFVAVNLYNSEKIIPTLARNLIRTIAWLRADNVYLSMFENASTDATGDMLAELAAALVAQGVKEVWMASPPLRSDYDHKDRVLVLAALRNMALRPLYEMAETDARLVALGREPLTNVPIETLIFSNDIVSCHSDTLEIVHQRVIQNADQVCSTDWDINPTLKLYDTWVERGLNGDLVYPFATDAGFSLIANPGGHDLLHGLLLPQDPADRQRWLSGLPVPMYSCWNGISAFDASLFTSLGLRFRGTLSQGWSRVDAGRSKSTAWDALLHSNLTSRSISWPDQEPGTTPYLSDDCAASECQILDRDIWNLRDGKARVVLAPRSRCAYDTRTYDHARRNVPLEKQVAELDGIEWDQVQGPDKVVCYGTRDRDGNPSDIWGGGRRNVAP